MYIHTIYNLPHLTHCPLRVNEASIDSSIVLGSDSGVMAIILSGSMNMCGVGQAVVRIIYDHTNSQSQFELTGVWTPILPSPIQATSTATISLSKTVGEAYLQVQ